LIGETLNPKPSIAQLPPLIIGFHQIEAKCIEHGVSVLRDPRYNLLVTEGAGVLCLV
jgi:hypothetical protein